MTNVKQHASTVDVLRATRLARVAFQREYEKRERQSRPHGTKAGMTVRSTRRITSRLGLNMRVMAHRRTGWFARTLAATPSRLDVFSDGASSCVMDRQNNVSTMLGRKIFILDLGCGTKAWERYIQSAKRKRLALRTKFIIVNVDIKPECKPDWLEDITLWRDWLPGRLQSMRDRYPEFRGFDHVHLSPECTELCSSKTIGVRDLDKALHLVQSGLALVSHFNPASWTVECSAKGRHHLATQACMADLNRLRLGGPDTDVSSCTFCKNDGAEGNQKPGSWWTNIPTRYLGEILNANCTGGSQCVWKLLWGEHACTSQNGASSNGTPGLPRDEGMALPALLMERWVNAILQWLWECEPDAGPGVISPATQGASAVGASTASTLREAPLLAKPKSAKRRSPYGPLRDLGDDVFEYEKVLSERQDEDGRYVLVKWRGMGKQHATWEPAANIIDVASRAVQHDL